MKSPGSAGEVFRVFSRLGLTSFGGPVAHLAYFHQELIVRRRWLSEAQYAQLLAICQFLPGPASSQLGFCLGLLRGGWLGALAAFVAFTLPSALLLVAVALLLPYLDNDTGVAVIHGLKIVAVVVVAHAVSGMARKLCPDVSRQSIAVAAAAIMLLSASAWAQLLVIAAGAGLGITLCRVGQTESAEGFAPPHGPRVGLALLLLFSVLLLCLPFLAQSVGGWASIAEVFYRAGALVFGGGHVVLPLLEESVVGRGWMAADTFLAGYGAAQAVPGPLFSFAAFLGAGMQDTGGWAAAVIALLFIFMPGFLLVAGVLPFWNRVTAHAYAGRAIAGVNAAVVGLLAAALYDPVWVSAIHQPVDVAIALVGWLILTAWGRSAIYVVMWCVLASLGCHFL